MERMDATVRIDGTTIRVSWSWTPVRVENTTTTILMDGTGIIHQYTSYADNARDAILAAFRMVAHKTENTQKIA